MSVHDYIIPSYVTTNYIITGYKILLICNAYIKHSCA